MICTVDVKMISLDFKEFHSVKQSNIVNTDYLLFFQRLPVANLMHLKFCVGHHLLSLIHI